MEGQSGPTKPVVVSDLPVLIPAFENPVLWITNDPPGAAGEVRDLFPRFIFLYQWFITHFNGRVHVPGKVLNRLDNEVIEEVVFGTIYPQPDGIGLK
jgi:hypothetical protein